MSRTRAACLATLPAGFATACSFFLSGLLLLLLFSPLVPPLEPSLPSRLGGAFLIKFALDTIKNCVSFSPLFSIAARSLALFAISSPSSSSRFLFTFSFFHSFLSFFATMAFFLETCDEKACVVLA